MKKILLLISLAMLAGSAMAQPKIPGRASEDKGGVMSKEYWNIWNDAEQARIDRDIEQYRKADATFHVGDIRRGTKVKVEQIKSEFVFGASSFNWNQLGSEELNAKYRNLFGTLFNRATVAFYWMHFEPEYGVKRYDETPEDNEKWWNSVKNPEDQQFWRRPPTNPIIDWCIEHGVAVHGHPLVWGTRGSQHPEWLMKEGLPAEQAAALDTLDTHRITAKKKKPATAKAYGAMSPYDLYNIVPDYVKSIQDKYDARIKELMTYYAGKIDSWDVVNESSVDFCRGNELTSFPMCKSSYGIMPADYTYHSFKEAEKYADDKVLLNINDYAVTDRYPAQIAHLLSRGVRMDILGSQMHLFGAKQCLDIANGKHLDPNKKRVEPLSIRSFFGKLGAFGIPACVSEVTITSPGENERGEMIQAIITRNLYRMWFSQELMMGITWWNVVDGCGLKGEPSNSGLFHRDMTPKMSFYALDELINHEWKTNVELKPDAKGDISFRGFKGTYRISWKGHDGKVRTEELVVK